MNQITPWTMPPARVCPFSLHQNLISPLVIALSSSSVKGLSKIDRNPEEFLRTVAITYAAKHLLTDVRKDLPQKIL